MSPANVSQAAEYYLRQIQAQPTYGYNQLPPQYYQQRQWPFLSDRLLAEPYQQPVQPYYQPAAPQYYQPAAPQYYQPAAPQYYQPAAPQYYQPAAPQYYQPPVQQFYQQAMPQYYQQPVQQYYQQPQSPVSQYYQPMPQYAPPGVGKGYVPQLLQSWSRLFW
jgi:hypothetical protein